MPNTTARLAAVRAGERSRALLRGEENPAEEASMLFLVAQVGWFADVFLGGGFKYVLFSPLSYLTNFCQPG